MEHIEETILIDGHEAILSHTPVRMLDETGNYAGMGTIDDVIDQGLWCRSVHVWIINPRGELYLQQRSMKVINNPGKWSESGGGYIDGDKSEEETVASELQEELGITIDPQLFEKIGTVSQLETRFDGKIGKQFVSVFLIEYDFQKNDAIVSDRDVKGTMSIHWSDFKAQLEKGVIDFVDHAEEISLVLSVISSRYPAR